MKVALVQMPPNPRDTPPYDVALRCALLRRAGHDVTVLDSNNDLYHRVYKQRPYWKFQIASHHPEPSEALWEQRPDLFESEARRILDLRPDVVVFSTENGLPNAIRLARRLRAERPSLALVSSGAQTADREALDGWKGGEAFCQDGEYRLPFDLHIVGEDDLVLPRALEALAAGRPAELAGMFRKTGKVIDAVQEPLLEDLDELPFYDFGDFDLARYADPGTLRLSVSRSCVKRCAFCIDWITVRRFRCMSGDRWYEEYRHQLTRHPGVVHIRHYDRLLNGRLPSLLRFCERMIAGYPGRPPVGWGGDCVITEEMDAGVIETMARAGCNNVGVGFESGSEKVRESVDKNFFSNATAARVLRACKRHGIAATLNVMVGLPAEEASDFEQTLRFILENREELHQVRITVPTAQIMRGSAMAVAPKRFGLADAHADRWTSEDGRNDYGERVRRFQVVCETMVERGIPLAVNRRTIKTAAAVRQLVAALRPTEERGRAARRAAAADAHAEVERLRERPAEERRAGVLALLQAAGQAPDLRAWLHVECGLAEEAAADADPPGWERAAEQYERAIALQRPALLGIACELLLNLAERTGGAAAVVRRGEPLLPRCDRFPGHASLVLFRVGRALLALGERERGETLLRRLVDRYPDANSRPYFEALLLLAGLLEPGEAEAERRRLLERFGDDAERARALGGRLETDAAAGAHA